MSSVPWGPRRQRRTNESGGAPCAGIILLGRTGLKAAHGEGEALKTYNVWQWMKNGPSARDAETSRKFIGDVLRS